MKKGLVLQGGGAKGAFEIGALKTLFAKGYSFDCVVGTSIGALNAAMIVQGDFDKTVRLWETVNLSDIIDIDDQMLQKLMRLDFDKSSIGYAWDFLKKTFRNRGVETEKMIRFVSSYIDEEKIRRSPMDFGLVTYNLDTKETVYLMKDSIPQGKLVDYVVASANYPLFERVVIDNERFIDGGIKDNLPINMLIERGYNELLAIRLGDSALFRPKDPIEGIKISYIDPSEDVGSALTFFPENGSRLLKLGEYDALRLTEGLNGIRYYIQPFDEREYIDKLAKDIPTSFYEGIMRDFDLGIYVDNDDALVKTSVFLSDLLSGEKDIVRIWLSLFELFASYLEVEKYEIYTIKEFFGILNEKVSEKGIELKSTLKKKLTFKEAKEKKALQVFVRFLQAMEGKTEN